MKKAAAPLLLLLALSACSPRLYNVTTHYDDAHFAELQKVIDSPTTSSKLMFSYTEAADLGLIGKMFNDTPNPYHRIDTARYKGMTDGERFQATVPAGLAVAFSTNSSAISVKTEWGRTREMTTTMPLSYRGYDLYIKNSAGQWQWAGAGCSREAADDEAVVLVKNLPEGEKECLLFLPIYCEVLSCKIGVTAGSHIVRLGGQFRHKLLFHGSSFTQGISTSRAGMSYPMQFMRGTGMEVLAFGMSGNCKLQPYFADVIADVEADAYVFDTFSNPDYKTISERLIPFIDRMIEAHPGKPLIFQQTIRRESRGFNMVSDATEQARQDMASSIFDTILKDPRYKDVYFITPDACEPGVHEYSVDGTHPDDHGYRLWYKSIEKPVLQILAKYGIRN